MKKIAIIFASIVMLLGSVFKSEAGEFLNKHLSKWVNVDVQLRNRYEWRSNFDFNDSAYDKDAYNLWRARLGLTLKPTDQLKLFYQFQDARISDDSTTGSKAAFENWVETRQLWVEYKIAKIGDTQLPGIGFKLGRQEISYGAQRLLGTFDWSNVAQTFDAGKVSLDFAPQKLTFDVFGGGKTPVKAPREADDFYDASANDRVGGYYATYKGIENVTVEQYVINRNTHGQNISYGQTGDGQVDDYTIGGRVVGKIVNTGFDYEVEAAKQVGNSGSLDVNAQMAIVILGYTFKQKWNPRVSFEMDYASGDDNPTDDKRQTFDNLYPTNHPFYGYMDLVSLQNIHDYRFQIKADPTKKLNLSADYHIFYLDSEKDNLYAANRTIKRSTSAAAVEKFVGNEIDLLAKYQLNSYVGVLSGYSHFFAGDFLDQTGANDDTDLFYVQTIVNF